MKKILYRISATLFFFLFSTTVIQAEPCPDDLAKKLYHALKTKLEWVDVNFNSESYNMTIRYYPCFSSRAPMDRLINKALKDINDYRLSNPGNHQLVEGYCVLRDIAFYSIS